MAIDGPEVSLEALRCFESNAPHAIPLAAVARENQRCLGVTRDGLTDDRVGCAFSGRAVPGECGRDLAIRGADRNDTLTETIPAMGGRCYKFPALGVRAALAGVPLQRRRIMACKFTQRILAMGRDQQEVLPRAI